MFFTQFSRPNPIVADVNQRVLDELLSHYAVNSEAMDSEELADYEALIVDFARSHFVDPEGAMTSSRAWEPWMGPMPSDPLSTCLSSVPLLDVVQAALHIVDGVSQIRYTNQTISWNGQPRTATLLTDATALIQEADGAITIVPNSEWEYC